MILDKPVNESSKSAAKEVPVRPTVALQRIESFLYFLIDATRDLNIDILDLYKLILQEERCKTFGTDGVQQIYYRKSSKRDKTMLPILPESDCNIPISYYYSFWYIHFIHGNICCNSITYSNRLKCFVNCFESPCNIENLTSAMELVALCKILGNQGLEVFDNILISSIVDNLSKLVENMSESIEYLLKLDLNGLKDIRTDLKGFKRALLKLKEDIDNAKNSVCNLVKFSKVINVNDTYAPTLSSKIFKDLIQGFENNSHLMIYAVKILFNLASVVIFSGGLENLKEMEINFFIYYQDSATQLVDFVNHNFVFDHIVSIHTDASK
ncbi:hypothetical protein ROZALSC1DRAFT_21677 [Rozella allomycis CSF55]|uniref:Uncharacterized protein n=1 Tax=Rozella allomycis (strain CSF55) TaxID=988480 RepID=A0A4P9YMG0_ROZAC|nr:hypothetical protein ROZALSC1DRAFT_21677 [Rozella allomycis CSF55]